MDNKSTENKDHKNAHDQDWKRRFNELVQSCQNELKRTTQIGMKMLNASQSNAQLREAYEQLGRLAKDFLKESPEQWNSAEAKELAEKIERLEGELEGLEQ